jgi:hypothetical protein
MHDNENGWMAAAKRNKTKLARAKLVQPPAQLDLELAKVRSAAPPPPSDDPIYKYLQRVYRLRCKVATSSQLQAGLKVYHQKHHPRSLRQYAGIIIEMTAGDHVTPNMKNKYVTAVEYAHKEGVGPNDFIEFVAKRGGLNKCGDLWRKKYGPRRQMSRSRQGPS